jgi:hypothetical protein
LSSTRPKFSPKSLPGVMGGGTALMTSSLRVATMNMK